MQAVVMCHHLPRIRTFASNNYVRTRGTDPDARGGGLRRSASPAAPFLHRHGPRRWGEQHAERPRRIIICCFVKHILKILLLLARPSVNGIEPVHVRGACWMHFSRLHAVMGLAELANAAILSRLLLDIENRNVVVPSQRRHASRLGLASAALVRNLLALANKKEFKGCAGLILAVGVAT